MASKVTAPRGMRDILPGEKARREWALSVIRSVYAAHGFDEIETPALETHERLHAGLGGDNEKLSFSVLKRGLGQKDLARAAELEDPETLADLGLRFDLTVPLTRYYATNRAQLPDVFRAVQIGPVWRAERPQKGRYRQFVQADIDIIGEPGLIAEAELIAATSEALSSLGLEGLTIRLNDRRVLTAMLLAAGFEAGDHARALISIDKLDKIGLEGVTQELRELNSAAAENLGASLANTEKALAAGAIAITETEMREVLPEGVSSDGLESLAELGRILAGALPAGVSLSFDPTLVRGMGYYTGTIFEISHPGSGSSVGGGGRYDGMVGRFLGQSVPAVGFSIGFERIIDLIDRESATKEHVALIFDTDADLKNVMQIKAELISREFLVRSVPKQKNMKAQLQRLQLAGVTSFASVTANDSKADDLVLKPLV